VTPVTGNVSGVTDQEAWQRFAQLVSEGGGVEDRPEREQAASMRSSAKFAALELARVEHHRRNAIPFLIDHCELADARVLEFGAGTGGLAVAMIQGGVRSITAIEPVRLNYQAGVWRTRAYGLEPVIDFVHLPDTAHLPFADGSYDAVVCSSVLQYVPERGKRTQLIREMARVIRPGGALVIQSTGNGLYPGGPHSTRWWSNLLPDRAARAGHNRGISYWELRRILAPCGFTPRPQRQAAFRRWRDRLSARPSSGLRRIATWFAFTAVRGASTGLGVLTHTPPDAFLPFPDMVFKKELQ
jgi:SAM-dependent methyltransferase